jgi:hypothetical protein
MPAPTLTAGNNPPSINRSTVLAETRSFAAASWGVRLSGPVVTMAGHISKSRWARIKNLGNACPGVSARADVPAGGFRHYRRSLWAASYPGSQYGRTSPKLIL